jgi:hypothetical protein
MESRRMFSKSGKTGGARRRGRGRGGVGGRRSGGEIHFLSRSPGGQFLIIYGKVVLAIQVKKK